MADHKLSVVLELEDKYSSTIKNSTTATKAFSKETEQATKKVGKEWLGIGSDVEKGSKAAANGFKTIEKGATQAATVLGRNRSAFNQFTSAATQAGRQAGKGLKDGVVKAAKRIPSVLGGTLKGVGKGIGMGLGMGIFSSLTGAISSAIGTVKNTIVGGFFSHVELEDQLVRNAGIMGITKDLATIEKLNKQVRDLGAATEYTSQEVALAHKSYAMAGWKADDIMTVTQRTLEFASATDISLDDASSIISNNLGALGWTANDADKLTDVMGKTALSSDQSVLDVAESFKAMAPMSRGRDSAEDLGIITGLLADQNIKGSNVGTFYSATAARINSDVKEVAEAREKLGIQTYRRTTYKDKKTGKERVKTERKSTLEIFEDIQKKLGKFNVKDQDTITAALFGRNYQSQAMALINAIPTEKYKELTRAIYESNGAIAEQYQHWKDESPMARVEALSSAWGGFKERLGSAVTPVALEYMENVEKYLNSTTFSTENIENFFGTLKDYAKEVQPVLGAVWDALKGIATIVSSGQEKKRYKEQRKSIDLLTSGMSTPGSNYITDIQAAKKDGSFKSAFSTQGLSEERANKINKAKEEQALRYIQFAIRRKNDSQESRDEYNRLQALIPNMKLEDAWNNHKWGKGVQTLDKSNLMKGIFGENVNPMELLKGMSNLKLQNDEPTKVEHDLKTEPFQITLKIEQEANTGLIEKIFRESFGKFELDFKNNLENELATQS